MNKYKSLLFHIIGVSLIAAIAGYFTRFGVNGWYQTAVPSNITPPNIWFRYVWTTLYILMAIAAWRISLCAKTEETKKSKTLFWTQLFLHIPWCFTFFYLGWLGMGFAVIIVMDFMAFQTIKSFAKSDKYAAYMLYPYLIWICYATILNLNYIINNGLVIQIS